MVIAQTPPQDTPINHTGICCAEPGCLASVSWLGHPTDPALGVFAKQSGWIVSEGRGWLCKRHKPSVQSHAD